MVWNNNKQRNHLLNHILDGYESHCGVGVFGWVVTMVTLEVQGVTSRMKTLVEMWAAVNRWKAGVLSSWQPSLAQLLFMIILAVFCEFNLFLMWHTCNHFKIASEISFDINVNWHNMTISYYQMCIKGQFLSDPAFMAWEVKDPAEV